MKTLGLHFGTQLTAVLLDEDRFVDSVVLPLDENRSEHADNEQLEAWIDACGSRIAATFTTDIRTRIVTFPFTQPRKIRQVLPLQLEEHLPGESSRFEQHIEIGQIEDQGIALVQLLQSQRLHIVREQLADLTPNARTLEPDVIAMARSRRRPAGAFVWIDAARTTVVTPSILTGVPHYFSIPIGADRIDDDAAARNLIVRIQSTLDQTPVDWQIEGDDRGIRALRDLLQAVYDDADITLPDDGPAETTAELRAALTAAQQLSARDRPYWNLAPRRPLLSPELTRSGLPQALAVPIIVLLLAATITAYSGNRVLFAQADNHRDELEEIYLRHFPDSRSVDPLRQMRAVVQRSQGDQSDASFGRISDGMAAFHNAITPGTDIMFSELRSSAGSWILRGEANDFGGVDQLKKSIESIAAFEDVRVQRAEQTVDKSAIRFSVSWNEKAI